jgi:predicted HNH restriction endonuclease
MRARRAVPLTGREKLRVRQLRSRDFRLSAICRQLESEGLLSAYPVGRSRAAAVAHYVHETEGANYVRGSENPGVVRRKYALSAEERRIFKRMVRRGTSKAEIVEAFEAARHRKRSDHAHTAGTVRHFWDQSLGVTSPSRVVPATRPKSDRKPAQTFDQNEETFEGSLISVTHLRRERNRSLRGKKLAETLRDTGKLQCECCADDYAAMYGTESDAVIQIHHRWPLSQSDGNTPTRLKDLAVVCANCHRMIHRRRKWLTVEVLAKRIASRT